MSSTRNNMVQQPATDDLATARVSRDGQGRYHLLDSNYAELCAPTALDRTNVYDTTVADLSDCRLCHRCRHQKRRLLGVES
jgi:hypothetical protein